MNLVVKVVNAALRGWMFVRSLLSGEKDFKIEFEARGWETKSRLAWTLYIMNARNWSTKSFDARWCSRSRNLNTKRRGKSALAARWRQPFTIVSIVTVTRHNRSWTTTKRSNNGFQVGRPIVTSRSRENFTAKCTRKGKNIDRNNEERNRGFFLRIIEPAPRSLVSQLKLRVDESIISTISLRAFDMLILFGLKVTFCSFVGRGSFYLLRTLIFES